MTDVSYDTSYFQPYNGCYLFHIQTKHKENLKTNGMKSIGNSIPAPSKPILTLEVTTPGEIRVSWDLPSGSSSAVIYDISHRVCVYCVCKYAAEWCYKGNVEASIWNVFAWLFSHSVSANDEALPYSFSSTKPATSLSTKKQLTFTIRPLWCISET